MSRARRGYDLRRTFISLARTDGARPDLLRLITHGPNSRDMLELYSTFEWSVLCEAVAKLKVQRRTPDNVVPMPTGTVAIPDDQNGESTSGSG